VLGCRHGLRARARVSACQTLTVVVTLAVKLGLAGLCLRASHWCLGKTVRAGVQAWPACVYVCVFLCVEVTLAVKLGLAGLCLRASHWCPGRTVRPGAQGWPASVCM